MREILENLDKSMKRLCLELRNYKKGEWPNNLLDALNHQYQSFEAIYDEYAKRSPENYGPYDIKYSDISEIRYLLIEGGYIEKPKSK